MNVDNFFGPLDIAISGLKAQGKQMEVGLDYPLRRSRLAFEIIKFALTDLLVLLIGDLVD